MTTLNFLNLLAVSSLAILACSFGPTATNALSVDHHNVARHISRELSVLAQKRASKRADGRRCKPRPAAAPKPNPDSKPNPGYGGSQPPNNGGYKPSPPPSPPSGPPPPAYNPPPGDGKVGIAWPNGDDGALHFYKTGRTRYLYTWSPRIPDSARKLGFNVMPMLWGWKQVDDFANLVKPGYANIALGFNEPNEPSQSNIDPATGAGLWRKYLAPLRHQGYRLGSPATTSAPSGLIWLQDFLKHCPDCNWDITTLHYYDVTPEGFIAYMNRFHDAFNLPVMPTEYACHNFNGGAQCSRDQTFRFHSMARDFMEHSGFIEAYFPFGVMHDMQGVDAFNQLMSGSGQPTDLCRMLIGS